MTESEEKYGDILNLPHHQSKVHPQMSIYDRAAQFSPFAALTGHEAAIKETARLTEEQVELDEDKQEELNEKLQTLIAYATEHPTVSVTYFKPDYETYNYTLPVPVVNGKHPYYAKAVLCYFPYCDRNQGVDYTGTEMDIHFGRVIMEKKNGTVKTKIKSIDDNKQTEEGQVMYEEDARNIFRKWDNVKRICEKIKDRRVPKKSYDAGMWGIGVVTKERVTLKKRRPLQFGLVITLKEMYGKNRIDDFAKMCEAKGWLVNRLDVQNQIDIYERAEEEIKFD